MTLEDFRDTRTDRNGNIVAYHTPREHRFKLALRVAELRALGLCINGPHPKCKPRRSSHIKHGPIVAGGRCQRCLDAKRRTH